MREGQNAYHHGNLRQALVDAGLAILQSEGLHALTLRAVARRAGVSPAAPYRHFTDGIAIAAAIAEQGLLLLRAELDAALDTATGGDPLHLLGQAYLAFTQRHPDHLRLMFSGHIPRDQRPPSLQAAGESAIARLAERIENAKTERRLPPETPTCLLALTAWSFVHGFSMLLIEGLIDLRQIPDSDPAALFAQCHQLLPLVPKS